MLKGSSPINVLSALVTLATDSIWKLISVDSLQLSSLGAIIGIAFLVCFITVSCIERFITGNEWAPSLTKGLVMGVVAGVPVLFVATTIGGILAIWAGADVIAQKKIEG